MDAKLDTPDRAASKTAARQHGVITRRQLKDCGLGSKGITIRVRKGQLNRIHRGVYAVGHKGLSWHGRWMAAVLACGEGAALSHGSAASLWGLLKPIEGSIHVSIPSTSGRTIRRGIHIHRCPSLAPPSPTEPSPSPSYPRQAGGRRGRLLVTHRDNIPVTTVPRTIEDLRVSSLVPPRLLRRAIRQAELKGHRLEGIETDRTRSDLEAAFLALFARNRIPTPEVNPRIGHYEVDFLWRAERLIVEADTFTYHRGSVSFEDDHVRDLYLRQRGYAIRRFTDKQLEAEPERVVADIRGALS
jgi:very-short-patch-repair endonuclease